MMQTIETVEILDGGVERIETREVGAAARIAAWLRDHDQQLIAAAARSTVEALRNAGWLRESAGRWATIKRIQRVDGQIEAIVETRELVDIPPAPEALHGRDQKVADAVARAIGQTLTARDQAVADATVAALQRAGWLVEAAADDDDEGDDQWPA